MTLSLSLRVLRPVRAAGLPRPVSHDAAPLSPGAAFPAPGPPHQPIPAPWPQHRELLVCAAGGITAAKQLGKKSFPKQKGSANHLHLPPAAQESFAGAWSRACELTVLRCIRSCRISKLSPDTASPPPGAGTLLAPAAARAARHMLAPVATKSLMQIARLLNYTSPF